MRYALPVHVRSCPTSWPEGKAHFESGRNWRLHRTSDELVFITGYADRERPDRVCSVTVNLTQCEIRADPAAGADFPLAYPIDQILSWGMLSRIQGVVIHAALIVRPDGTGIVLAGRSGAGKSTLSAYCAEAGWTVLNDDRAIVYLRDGMAFASGTPWHGSGRYAEQRTVPLSAMLFLAQAGENRLEDLPRPEILEELLRVTSVPWFEDTWTTPALATLDELARSTPMRRLHFRRDPSAVQSIADDLT